MQSTERQNKDSEHFCIQIFRWPIQIPGQINRGKTEVRPKGKIKALSMMPNVPSTMTYPKSQMLSTVESQQFTGLFLVTICQCLR